MMLKRRVATSKDPYRRASFLSRGAALLAAARADAWSKALVLQDGSHSTHTHTQIYIYIYVYVYAYV